MVRQSNTKQRPLPKFTVWQMVDLGCEVVSIVGKYYFDKEWMYRYLALDGRIHIISEGELLRKMAVRKVNVKASP
jgi:hypothetical protein